MTASLTGVGKRQLHRVLGELVASGKARLVDLRPENERSAFYERVA